MLLLEASAAAWDWVVGIALRRDPGDNADHVARRPLSGAENICSHGAFPIWTLADIEAQNSYDLADARRDESTSQHA